MLTESMNEQVDLLQTAVGVGQGRVGMEAKPQDCLAGDPCVPPSSNGYSIEV